ncbi:MAG TPA: ClbS/DfsB family four-helix bundle protein [Ktedonobacteraceae bacterium]|nr:ClbS/DfsB family four-helix bundle protein [Ktedonobacteraceae bacterium]
MADTLFQAVLLKLLQNAYDAQQTWLDGLSAEERAVICHGEAWSARDRLVYLTLECEQMAQSLEAMQCGEQGIRHPGIEALHAQVFQNRHEQRTFKDILRAAQIAHDRLIALVQYMSEEDLTTLGRVDWIDPSEPLGVAIMGAAYAPPFEQIAHYYALDKHDLARSTYFQERLVEQVMAEDVPDSAKGLALYNLACYYATHNMVEKAPDKLREALSFYPHLREWALNDPDLLRVRSVLKQI